jgi:hypothetical protein
MIGGPDSEGSVSLFEGGFFLDVKKPCKLLDVFVSCLLDSFGFKVDHGFAFDVFDDLVVGRQVLIGFGRGGSVEKMIFSVGC